MDRERHGICLCAQARPHQNERNRFRQVVPIHDTNMSVDWHIDAKQEIASQANGPQSRKKRKKTKATTKARATSPGKAEAKPLGGIGGIGSHLPPAARPQSRDRMNRSRGLNPLVSECICVIRQVFAAFDAVNPRTNDL